MVQNPTAKTDRDMNAAVDNTTGAHAAGDPGLAERAASLATGAMDAGRQYAAPLREAGQVYAQRLYKTGEQRAQEAAFYAELGYEETRDLVRSHPVPSLGIAAGIGMLLGLLVARR